MTKIFVIKVTNLFVIVVGSSVNSFNALITPDIIMESSGRRLRGVSIALKFET